MWYGIYIQGHSELTSNSRHFIVGCAQYSPNLANAKTMMTLLPTNAPADLGVTHGGISACMHGPAATKLPSHSLQKWMARSH